MDGDGIGGGGGDDENGDESNPYMESGNQHDNSSPRATNLSRVQVLEHHPAVSKMSAEGSGVYNEHMMPAPDKIGQGVIGSSVSEGFSDTHERILSPSMMSAGVVSLPGAMDTTGEVHDDNAESYVPMSRHQSSQKEGVRQGHNGEERHFDGNTDSDSAGNAKTLDGRDDDDSEPTADEAELVGGFTCVHDCQFSMCV
jgi:hypothetical protein